MEQKLRRKKLKYESILKKDLNIEASYNPTKVRTLKLLDIYVTINDIKWRIMLLIDISI